jgi:hypothetical protein
LIEEIYVTDMTGKKLDTHTLNGFQTQIDLSGYGRGIYLLVIQSGSTVIVRKVSRK